MEFLRLIAMICLIINALYTIMLIFLRHCTFEDRGIKDSFKELILIICTIVGAETMFQYRTTLVYSIFCLISAYLISRSYDKYVRGVKYDPVSLNDKVFIVTGSNTGIGLETAAALVKMGGRVVLACRC